MLWFYLRSLFTVYGWVFVRDVCVFHPAKTIKAIIEARRIKTGDDFVAVSVRSPEEVMESARPIVGIGFCMKPRVKPCPSGIANHDCLYLDGLSKDRDFPLPVACGECYIRKTGLAALRANAAFYIMTSARDIILDVYKPGLKKTFDAGHFILCRYSFKPFFIGMKASGIKGCMFPFDVGDCRDYKTWSEADRGEKPDRTTLDGSTRSRIEKLIGSREGKGGKPPEFERRGHVFFPLK